MSNNKVGPFLPQGFPLPNHHPLPSKDTDLAPQGFLKQGRNGLVGTRSGGQCPGGHGAEAASSRASREAAGEMLMTSDCLSGSRPRRQCPGTPRHKAAGGGIWQPVCSGETRPVRQQRRGPAGAKGGALRIPKMLPLCPPCPASPGVSADGWMGARPLMCKAQSRAGREPLWRSPRPPTRPSPLQALGRR